MGDEDLGHVCPASLHRELAVAESTGRLGIGLNGPGCEAIVINLYSTEWQRCLIIIFLYRNTIHIEQIEPYLSHRSQIDT